jgi:geranylgeranyl reductase family protein
VRERDAVVVGGGPAGAAVATFLKQQGRDVLLLDQARFPRDKICGESVSPEAWRLLEAMGVAADVRARDPMPVRGMRLVAPDGTAFGGDYRGAAQPGFALRRTVLDEVLLGGARRAGVEIHEGARVTGLLRERGRVRGVRVEEAGETRELRARLVLGCDGRRSLVARALGLLREHPRLTKFAVRGYWEGVAALEPRGEMHVGGGGYCGLAPLSPTRANLTFVLDRRELGAAGGDLEGFYRRTLGRWPELSERLRGARLEEPPRAIGPLALVARRVSAPGVLLAGDSAGFYDPFTGEGVTLALRSAELAAAVADRHLDGRAELSEYDRARDAATRQKFRLNRILQRVVASETVASTVARRLSRRPELADRLVGIAGDFVPAREAFGLRFLWDLVRP